MLSPQRSALLSLLTVLGAVSGARAQAADKAVCSTQRQEMASFEQYLRGVVSQPRLAALRNRLQLPAVPADSVVIIQDESLCDRAAKGFPLRSPGPLPSRRDIRLARVGRVYFVEDGRMAGEWIIGAVLDHDMKRVLARSNR